MWSNKNKRIEFFNSEPSAVDNFPIIESKDLKLNWVKEAKKDFQNRVKGDHINAPSFKHITRCPGIFDLFKHGYIITLHKDIIIDASKKSEKKIGWILPNDYLAPRPEALEVTGQGPEWMARPPWVEHDFLLKVDTGWHVVAPKGVKFLMLPIVYPDTFEFTAATGILDPAISTEINFQLYINVPGPEIIIRAGTPLGQLIPLTEKKYEWTQRIMNQKDKVWVEKIASAYSSSFWHTAMRGKVVAMYNKYWK